MMALTESTSSGRCPSFSSSYTASHLQALGDGVEVDVGGVEGDDLACGVGHGSLLDGGTSGGLALEA